MRPAYRGWLSAWLLLLVLAAVPAPAAAGPDNPEDREKVVLEELFSLNRSLQESRTATVRLEQQILENGLQQEEARADRTRLAGRLQERQTYFGRRLRYFSENGALAPLAVLVGSRSLPEFLDRLDMLGYLLRRDAALMKEIRSLRAGVEEQERLLAVRQAELGRLQQEQHAREQQLQQAIMQKESILSGLLADREAMEQKLAELEQVWATAAEPVLANLGESLHRVDMSAFEPDSIQFGIFPPGAVVRISEGNLNAFLSRQTDLKGLAFQLLPGQINLIGEYQGVQITILGGFTVTEKTILRYELQELRVKDFTVPRHICEAILASGQLDIDLTPLVNPWVLQKVWAEQGALVVKTGIAGSR